MKRIAVVLFLFATAQAAFSADFVIRKITLQGNKQTRPSIVFRELTLHEGDLLDSSSLAGALHNSRDNLFNTSLFNVVRIDTAGTGAGPRELTLTVNMIERWYIWPVPWIEFPDHNLNAWLKDPVWSHLTYGINLSFFNARGRNETLTLLLHFGYNQKYGFSYKTPYINRNKTWGFSFGGDAELNRTLAVACQDGKNVYYDVEAGFLQQHYLAFAEVFHRPAWYLYHTLNVSYNYYVFSDTLRSVEGFFADDTTLDQSLFSFTYKLKYDRRDEKYYPLQGYYADIELSQTGFPGQSAEVMAVKSSFRGYWQLARRWFVASGATARASFPQEQPFYLQEGLGFGRDYLRGYDSYIIPGRHFVASKNNLKFAILPKRTINLSFIQTEKFSVVPCALYLNLFCDLGYAWNDDKAQSAANPLTNTFLLGSGLGLDFTTYYDIVIGVGFSFNIQGTPGAFIHFTAPI
jgi:outer membrane protein assembly factor BamA